MKNVLKTSVLVLSVFMMSNFAIAKEKVNKEKTAERVAAFNVNCDALMRETMADWWRDGNHDYEQLAMMGSRLYQNCIEQGGDPY